MPTMTAADVRALGKRLSNWGRWGDDDERGTLNFVTRDVVRAACALPQEGRVLSLAIDFHAAGPMPFPAGQGRYNVQHRMTETGGQDFPGGFEYADDVVDLVLQSATQWDSLAHVFYDGFLYNGRPAEVVTAEGAGANSIDKIRDGVLSRGVLLDVARHRGLPWLEDGDAVTPAELDACVLAAGTEVRSGDVVVVRTGRVGRAAVDGWTPDFVFGPSPGLSIHCAAWLHDREVAAVAVDNVAVEVQPVPGAEEVDDCLMPLHMVCLRDMGMTFGEIFDLEALGAACAELGRYEFLLTAPPLPILGAVGSPINPLAVL